MIYALRSAIPVADRIAIVASIFYQSPKELIKYRLLRGLPTDPLCAQFVVFVFFVFVLFFLFKKPPGLKIDIVYLFFLSCFSRCCSRTPPASRALLGFLKTAGV